MAIKSGTAILQTDTSSIPLAGRVLSIVLELVDYGEEINQTSPHRAQIEIHCKEEDVSVSLKKWKEK